MQCVNSAVSQKRRWQLKTQCLTVLALLPGSPRFPRAPCPPCKNTTKVIKSVKDIRYRTLMQEILKWPYQCTSTTPRSFVTRDSLQMKQNIKRNLTTMVRLRRFVSSLRAARRPFPKELSEVHAYVSDLLRRRHRNSVLTYGFSLAELVISDLTIFICS